MARSQKLRYSRPDGQQAIAKPGTGHQRSGRVGNDRCTQFDDSPFQSDKIHFKECIEAFPASSSSLFDGKKAVNERRTTIIHPSQWWSKAGPAARVPELQTEVHQSTGNVTARSDDLDSIEFHRVTPSYRNTTGEVRIENQWVPLVTDAHPQTAPRNVEPAKIAFAVTFLFILLSALGITLCKCWHDKRELKKKQKLMNVSTEEWVMSPVTGGHTSPDELQKLFLDEARENAKKEAEKRKASRLNFAQDNCGGGSWEFILDRPLQAHQRSGGM
jgi:hypothetical protein